MNRPTIANFQDDLRMGLWHLTGELHMPYVRIHGEAEEIVGITTMITVPGLAAEDE